MELWRTVPDGAREIPPGGVCPKCRSPKVHRSRVRNAFERGLRAVGPWRPFSCSACSWRGWVWPDTSQGPVIALPPVPARPKRRSHSSSGKRIFTPAELQKQRYRRHVMVAFLLASLAGGALLYCQEEPPPSAQQ